MLCPRCNYDNKNSNIKCERCGEELITEKQIEEIDLNKVTPFTRLKALEKNNPLVAKICGIEMITLGIILMNISFLMIYKSPDGLSKYMGIALSFIFDSIIISGILMLFDSTKLKKAGNNKAKVKQIIIKSRKNTTTMCTIGFSLFVLTMLYFLISMLLNTI